MYKLNAKSDANKVLNQHILETLAKQGYDISIHGHATKVNDQGKKYRYKFQATSIRYEVQVEHAASQYSPASKSWVLVKTVYYSQLKVKSNG